MVGRFVVRSSHADISHLLAKTSMVISRYTGLQAQKNKDTGKRCVLIKGQDQERPLLVSQKGTQGEDAAMNILKKCLYFCNQPDTGWEPNNFCNPGLHVIRRQTMGIRRKSHGAYRRRRACVIANCSEHVINLSRHLRTKHQIGDDSERRRMMSLSKLPGKRPLRQCLLCPQRVVNLSKHVKSVHGTTLSKSCGTPQHQDMTAFKNHLCGPRGLSEQTARQYVSYVIRASPRGGSKILSAETWTAWWDPHEGHLRRLREASGINTYITHLHALHAFAEYCLYEGRDMVAATQLQARIRMWRKAAAKEKERRRIQLKQEASEKIHRVVVPAILDFALRSEQILLPPHDDDFRTFRDHLIVATLISNGNRSGVVRNLRTDEFDQARHHHASGKYIVCVSQHKTNANFVARVVLTKEVWEGYKTFQDRKKSQSEYFFTTGGGRQLKSGDVALITRKYLNATPTEVRKAIYAIAHTAGNTSGEINNIAAHLCHSRETAVRYYCGAMEDGDAINAHSLILLNMKK